MAQVMKVLNSPDYETVKPARWRDTGRGAVQVETNYVYGEGTVRFYHGASQVPEIVLKIRGRDREMDAVWLKLGRGDLHS